MTREQAIKRWTEIIPAVWRAELTLRQKWQGRLAEAKFMPADKVRKLSEVYIRAVAEEIVSKTSDEQLKEMDDGCNKNDNKNA